MQPEKPRSLRLEPAPTVYSDSMPDIRRALEWREADEAQADAARLNRPIFAVVVAHWSTGAHLVFRELENPEVRDLIEEKFVPMLIDPVESPALTARLAALARYQGGSGALPLFGFLTPQLSPSLSITYLSPDQRPSEMPSIPALLQSVLEQWEVDPASFDFEWNKAQVQLQPADQGLVKDLELGGFDQYPRQLNPYTLAEQRLDDASAHRWLLTTLTTLWNHGIRDQLEASFHPQTRNASWAVPFFEKILPQNAAMAAVYARVAKTVDSRDLRLQAQDLVRVTLSAVLQKTDVISAESQYYTWISSELYDTLSRENLQPVSMVYNVQPSGNRQVLNKMRTVEDLSDFSYEPKETLERRFLQGNAELLMHRRTRPAPRSLTLENPSWRAETWRWLFLAADALGGTDISLMKSGYLTWLEEITPTLEKITPTLESKADHSEQSFQANVSILASLVVAGVQTSDSAIEELLPRLQHRVNTGIQHWQHVEPVDALWLYQHGYLPSVASTLRAIADLLPEGADMLPLGER